MMTVEEAEVLGEIAHASESGERNALSRGELRNELQRFASTELQYELAKACTHLREELLKALHESQLAGKGGFANWKTSPHFAGDHVLIPDYSRIVDAPEPPDVGQRPLPMLPAKLPSSSSMLPSQASLSANPGDHLAPPGCVDYGASSDVRTSLITMDGVEDMPRIRRGKGHTEDSHRVSQMTYATERDASQATASALMRCRRSMTGEVCEEAVRASQSTESRRPTMSTVPSNAYSAWTSPAGGIALHNKYKREARAVKQSAMLSKLSWRRKRMTAVFDQSEALLPEVLWEMRKRFVQSVFEHGISLCIVLNGIFIGIQTDYQARNLEEDVPFWFVTVEIVFCVIFTFELTVKLIVYRWSLYLDSAWMWNIFDTLLVLVQLAEVVAMVAADTARTQSFSFVRLLRVLRVLRIVRLFRLLRFVDELAVVVNSIAHSFKSLCSALALLCMMIYMVGIVCAQVIFTHRVGLEEPNEDLENYFGSLPSTFLTLYQAILGGVDWENLTTPMKDISPLVVLFFCMYIAFALMAVMNVITGTFVQSAVRDAENDKMKDFSMAARQAFAIESEEYVTYGRFEHAVDDTNFAIWLENMQIKSADAKLLFHILDNGAGSEGYVEIKSIIDGLIKTRDNAKYMDVMKMMFEDNRERHKFEEWTKITEYKLDHLALSVSEYVLAAIYNNGHHGVARHNGDHLPVSAKEGLNGQHLGEYQTPSPGASGWPQNMSSDGKTPSDGEIECLAWD